MESSVMDQLCGSEFWNASLTWNTDDPDFTECFKKTVLVWFPCAILWILCPLEIYLIRKATKRSLPRNWLLMSKMGLMCLIISLSIADLAMAIYAGYFERIHNVEYYTPSIKIATITMAVIIVVYDKLSGRRNSGPLFVFWLLLVICGAVEFRSSIRSLNFQVEPTYRDTSFLIYYSVACVVFILNFFAEGKPIPNTEQSPAEQTSPLEFCSFPSYVLFISFDALAWKGFRKSLGEEDLWLMKYEDTANGTRKPFEKYWQRDLKMVASYRKVGPSREKRESDGESKDDKETMKIVSIVPVIWKSFRPIILAGACLKLAESILLLVSPQILKLLINFVSGDAPLWKGYLYAGLFLVVRSFCTLSTIHHANYMRTAGMRVRTALTGAIYRKSLKITNSARKQTTVGEIVNLISVDVQALVTFSTFAHIAWASPMDITITLFFLWNILGASVFAGFAIMVISIPFHMLMSNKVLTFKHAQMKKKDSRLKLINEILNGIKILKLCAWELCFEKQITKIRKEEMDILRNYWFCNVGMTFAWTWIPSLVCLVSLTTYVVTDESHVLDAPTVFVSLSLFNLIQVPMASFPEIIATAIQALVSLRRINKFMNAEELDENDVEHDSDEEFTLLIENGEFSWIEDKSAKPTLRNINLHVKENQLVAIVGSVGSGKTSLLSALLGEIDRLDGRVNTKGTIAYVSQQAWIQNASVRDNILFGSPYDKKLYERVIDGCALSQDLEVLPAGDRTEIGEKGINLSGGQKQRISLARAVYNGADVYLFDDPLSAVDAHVGKHIFDNVIGPNGMLKGKTRVIVTHGLSYLCEVDDIFVLNDGEITERGTYDDLLKQKGAFSELLWTYLQTDATNKINETDAVHVNRNESTIDEEKPQAKSSNTIPPVPDIFIVSEPSPKNASVADPTLDIQTAIKKRFGGLFRRRNATKKEVAVVKDNAKCIDVENMEKGIVKWRIYYHYICSIGGLLTLSAVLVRILYEVCSIGAHMWLTIWTGDKNTTVDGIVDIDRRNTYLGVYGALTTGQAIFTLITLLVLAFGTVRSSRLLHDKLLFSILRVPVSFFEVTPCGRILNRFGKDIDTVDSVLPRVFKAWLYSFVTVSGAILVITYSTPIFISVIIPLAIVYYFIQCVYLASSRQLMRLQAVARSPILSYMSESIAGCQTIRAYRVEERFGRESERLIDVHQVRAYCSMVADRWLMLRLEILGNLVVFFAALFAVLQRDTLSAGLVGLSVTYGLQVTNYLQWMVKSASELESNIISVERIKEYDNVAREAPWEIAENTPAKEWPQEGRIEFRDYKLRYREGLDLALRGLTFSVKGSEKVGIVGRTGAGKSSLALALFRIIESAGGQIIIDDVDISTIGLHSLRSKLTIIPQDPVLFSGSFRLNLDPFDLHTDEEVWAALENAELKKFVQGLEGGLMHNISEGGDNLSVGQRQLACLARALLRKTKIIVLDEATASVDVETDDFIQRTIRKEFADCTILTIAHRLNTILDSDKVIVLNGGRVTECGSPQDLLQNKNGEFYSMAKDAGLVG